MEEEEEEEKEKVSKSYLSNKLSPKNNKFSLESPQKFGIFNLSAEKSNSLRY